VEIMNCIVSFKYESEVMITARPNHRPTRPECLLIYQFAILDSQEMFLINFPEVQHSNRTSKQSSTKQGVGRATPEVRGVNSLWEEYTPLPEMV